MNLSVAFYLTGMNLTKLRDPYKTLSSLGVSEKMTSNRCDLIVGELLNISKPQCPHL